jgi:F-type H+-transporting ATPase subunit delta
VDISAGIKASLAGRYASALFDLASESGVISNVESDLNNLASILNESPDLKRLITNPRLSRITKKDSIMNVARHLGMCDLSTNFLGVLAQNSRLSALNEIIKTFILIAASKRGEVTAEVTSAYPLGGEQVAELQKKLTAREGRTVKISSSVDPSLLGGLVVTVGSQRIDGSIRTRLNSLAQALRA